jgi:hypothetical protein
MLRSREAKRCVDRVGDLIRSKVQEEARHELNQYWTLFRCLFCTEVLCCMPLETRIVEELIVKDLFYE